MDATTKEFTLRKDRSFTFVIDKLDAAALTSGNIYDEVIKANNELDNVEVPETGRYLVVTERINNFRFAVANGLNKA